MAGRRFRDLGDLLNQYAAIGLNARNKLVVLRDKFYCLDRILDEVSQIQQGLKGKSIASDDAAEILRTLVWVQFLAETFVYHAFRLYKELSRLPGLGELEPKGVRDARTLLEHFWDPIAANATRGFAIFDMGWPYIRSQRLPGERAEPIDKGLWSNADEFIDQLETKLKNAIEQQPRQRAP